MAIAILAMLKILIDWLIDWSDDIKEWTLSELSLLNDRRSTAADQGSCSLEKHHHAANVRASE